MIYNTIIIIISLILDSTLNLILKSTSYFLPLFTLISLIFIYPYFKNDKKSYLFISILIGFIYDIFNTYYFILNPIIFLIISDIIFSLYHRFKFNFITVTLFTIFIVFIYQILLLLIFNLTNYQIYTINEFTKIISHYFIINILYSAALYFIFKKINE